MGSSPVVALTLPSLNLRALHVSEVARDVLHVRLTLLVVPDLRPERTGLLEVDCSTLSRCSKING